MKAFKVRSARLYALEDLLNLFADFWTFFTFGDLAKLEIATGNVFFPNEIYNTYPSGNITFLGHRLIPFRGAYAREVSLFQHDMIQFDTYLDWIMKRRYDTICEIMPRYKPICEIAPRSREFADHSPKQEFYESLGKKLAIYSQRNAALFSIGFGGTGLSVDVLDGFINEFREGGRCGLTSLDLSGTDHCKILVHDLEIILKCCPNLQHLELDFCEYITNAVIEHIANYCPKLISFKLRSAMLDTVGGAITQECIPHLNRLTDLDTLFLSCKHRQFYSFCFIFLSFRHSANHSPDHGCFLNDASVELLQLPNLRVFRFCCRRYLSRNRLERERQLADRLNVFTGSGLPLLSLNCPQLKEIHLFLPKHISEFDYFDEFVNSRPDLIVITFRAYRNPLRRFPAAGFKYFATTFHQNIRSRVPVNCDFRDGKMYNSIDDKEANLLTYDLCEHSD